MVYALDPGTPRVLPPGRVRRDDGKGGRRGGGVGAVVDRERQCAHSDQLRMLRLQPLFEVLLEVGHGVQDGFDFCLAGGE